MAIPVKPKIDLVPLPGEPGLKDKWGKKIETSLVRFMVSVYNATIGPLLDAIGGALNHYVDKLAEEVRPWLIPFLDRLEAIPGLPSEIREASKRLRGTPALPLAAIGTVIGALIGLLSLLGVIDPVRRLIAQEVDSYLHSARMSPVEAFTALKRGAITPEEYHNQVSDHGWSERFEKVWQEILAPLVGVGDLGRLFLRGELSDGEFDAQMGKRGYTSDEIGRVKILLQVIPPLPDIIRMAVREAFTPSVVDRFQLHAELPGEMVKWAEKQGLSTEWAKAYWAAHWELPSLRMGFEMLHRGEISESDMKLLIRTHDVSPFWRDKLLAISYTPYTRVDVRRMYNSGVLDIEGVYRSYRDIGYNHEKATKMTEFTVALSNAAERDLTKTDVLNGLKIGYFTPEVTKQHLIALGYDDAEADYYISKVMYDLWQKQIKEQVKYLQQQFVTGLISETDVHSELGRLNLPSTQINRYLLEWDIKRKAKTKTLTRGTLGDLRRAKIIDDTEYRTEMSGIGYRDKYINWLLEHIKKGG